MAEAGLDVADVGACARDVGRHAVPQVRKPSPPGRPTSGLDADAEHALFEHYASAASRAGRDTGAVTVLISYRFSTVRLADLIVVVDGGRVRSTAPTTS